MGLLDSIFGGGGNAADDPYADILTPAQRNQMQVNGLLAMAGAFADAGMPSRLPIPFGSALGKAAQALGAGQEAGMKTAIENALAAQKVRDLRNLSQYRSKFFADQDPTSPLSRAIQQIISPGGTAAPAVPSAGGTPPAGTYAGPGAGTRSPAAGAADAPSTVELPYPAPGSGGGLLYPNVGAESEYGAGKQAGGLLSPTPSDEKQAASLPPAGAANPISPLIDLPYPDPTEKGISAVPRQNNQSGTDYLSSLASAAAPYALPPGYSVAMTPRGGERPGATVAGTGGQSQHAIANAGDFVIKDDRGQPIPNTGEDTTGHYGRLAVTMRQLADPAVRQQVAWGGNFPTASGARDLMHVDLGGDRGRYGSLAALEQAGGLLGSGPEAASAPSQTGLLAGANAPGLTGSAWEAANNNLGGLRRPGVPAAGPSQGGFQSFGTPQEGLAAISRQLDRYASGATTGTPLTTVRQIVSTWAPPNENDTPALIQRASRVMGVDPDQPLDVSNPAVKAKLIEATIRNEQGDRLPVDQQLIQQAAALPGPDQVIPSGPGAGGNPMMQLAQYAPGGGGGGGAAMPAAPGAAPLPGMPGGPPQYPAAPAAGNQAAVSTLLLELARRNAAAEVLGMGNPYGSLLTVLQGSPQYKAQVEAAVEDARRRAGLGYKKEESRLEAEGKLPSEMARDTNKGVIDELNKKIEQMGAAALNPAGTLLVNTPNGPVEKPVTQLQSAQARAGFDVPEIGFKGMRGPLPAGQIPGLGPAGGSAAGTPGPQAQGVTPGGAGTLYDKPYQSPTDIKSSELGVTAGWKALEDTHAAELAANRRDQQLGQLAEAMQGFRPGATAEIRTRGAAILRDLGLIKGDEVPSAETFQRAARQLQITAAPKGQGSTSNYERELYAEAVPAIVNSPESLAKAVEIAQRLDQYDRSVAQIHRDVASANRGSPDLIEAQRRIAKLGPPLSPGEIGALEQIRAGKVPGQGQAATAPAAGGIDKATYDRLPSGATYTAPDGTQRTKP